MNERLDSLTQQELASRLTINCTNCNLDSFKLKDLKMTIIDVLLKNFQLYKLNSSHQIYYSRNDILFKPMQLFMKSCTARLNSSFDVALIKSHIKFGKVSHLPSFSAVSTSQFRLYLTTNSGLASNSVIMWVHAPYPIFESWCRRKVFLNLADQSVPNS